MHKREHTIVATRAFIDAIRDAGYRGPAAALAELIDNAFEADATTVRIDVTSKDTPVVTVTDDGTGMSAQILERALQFGGSSRFDSRAGAGRYGMGLPAGSISQSRRVDVYTWTTAGRVTWSYLDVDEIRSGAMPSVPAPKRIRPPFSVESDSGTVVVWSNCDRLRGTITPAFLRSVRADLACAFREHLWAGKTIIVAGEPLHPIDPLLRHVGFSSDAAADFGPAVEFPVRLVDAAGIQRRGSVHVAFTELPIEKWQGFTNEQKRAYGISKRAGVSVLRAGRQIDTGWFFMGGKRRENYDDWWRCEVRFTPELDEFFGVTHTKQGIHPTMQLEAILAPHIERTAHELNRRVRATFVRLRDHHVDSLAANQATRRDHLIEPPRAAAKRHQKREWAGSVRGLIYRVERRKLPDSHFFSSTRVGDEVRVVLNQEHPFDGAAYGPGAEPGRVLELVLLAAARAEARFRFKVEKEMLRKYREHWSNVLAAFLA